jgi:hypothetical protein
LRRLLLVFGFLALAWLGLSAQPQPLSRWPAATPPSTAAVPETHASTTTTSTTTTVDYRQFAIELPKFIEWRLQEASTLEKKLDILALSACEVDSYSMANYRLNQRPITVQSDHLIRVSNAIARRYRELSGKNAFDLQRRQDKFCPGEHSVG